MLLDGSNSPEVTEPAAPPGFTEDSENGSITGSDRLEENENDTSLTDISTKDGHDADGCADEQTGDRTSGCRPQAVDLGQFICSPTAEDSSGSADDLDQTEKNESTGLLNDHGDCELRSVDSGTDVDKTRDNTPTQHDSIGVAQEASAKCNFLPSHGTTVNDVGNTDCVTVDHIDLTEVGTAELCNLTVVMSTCSMFSLLNSSDVSAVNPWDLP